MDCGKEKLFWIDVQSSFCFLKCDALVIQITKWETPTKTEQKKLKKSLIIIPFCSSYFSG